MRSYWDDNSFQVYSGMHLPAKPSRDELIDIQIHFQGLQIDSVEFGPKFPIFEIFTPSFLQEDQERIFLQKKNLGDTHAHIALSYKYPSYGPSGNDFTKALPTFRSIILDRILRGFYPIVSLAADGQVFNPDGWTYGYQYVMDNMYRIIGSYADLLGYTITMGGFELLGPGGDWTPKQIDDFHIQLRDVMSRYYQPNAVIALELGPGYDKWYEDGVACWSGLGGQEIDVLLQELPQPVQLNLDGCQQLASRNLGPHAKNIKPQNIGTYYQITQTSRGKRGNCAFEFALSAQLHEHWTPQMIEIDRQTLRDYGFTSTG